MYYMTAQRCQDTIGDEFCCMNKSYQNCFVVVVVLVVVVVAAAAAAVAVVAFSMFSLEALWSSW